MDSKSVPAIPLRTMGSTARSGTLRPLLITHTGAQFLYEFGAFAHALQASRPGASLIIENLRVNTLAVSRTPSADEGHHTESSPPCIMYIWRPGSDEKSFQPLFDHLESCAECARFFEQLTASDERVRRTFQSYPQSPFLESRILSGLAHQRAQAAVRRRGWRSSMADAATFSSSTVPTRNCTPIWPKWASSPRPEKCAFAFTGFHDGTDLICDSSRLKSWISIGQLHCQISIRSTTNRRTSPVNSARWVKKC
jgi:hypothetical protein